MIAAWWKGGAHHIAVLTALLLVPSCADSGLFDGWDGGSEPSPAADDDADWDDDNARDDDLAEDNDASSDDNDDANDDVFDDDDDNDASPTLVDGGTGDCQEDPSECPQREDCWDKVDNNDDNRVDCADAECASLASCCLSGGCCDPTGNDYLGPLLADACITSPASCSESSFAFGQPRPSRQPDGKGLLPNGNDNASAGWVLATDLSSELRWSAVVSLSAPGPSQCSGACLELVGAGFLPGSLDSDEEAAIVATEQPLVAVVVSSALGQALLIAGPEVLGTLEVAPGTHSYQLDLHPNGHVQLTVDRTETTESRLDLSSFPPRTSFAVFGRNSESVDPLDRAYVGAVNLAEAPCDTPWRWPAQASVEGSTEASQLSIAIDDQGHPRVAYTLPNGIYSSVSTSSLAKSAIPLLDPTIGASHPELVWQAGGWQLYFSLSGAVGPDRIARGLVEDDRVRKYEVILDPLDYGLQRLYGSSVLEFDGRRLITATAVTEETQQLVIFEERVQGLETESKDAGLPMDARAPADASVPVDASVDASTVPSDAGASGADGGIEGRFEPPLVVVDLRDSTFSELGTSELIAHNGTYQLYFSALRSGVRSIFLRASDDLVHWRDLDEVLSPVPESGVVGFQHPDLLVTEDTVTMYVTQLSEAGFSIGRARRSTTSFLGLPK